MILTQRPINLILPRTSFYLFTHDPQQSRTEFQLKNYQRPAPTTKWFKLAPKARSVTHRRLTCRPRDYYKRHAELFLCAVVYTCSRHFRSTRFYTCGLHFTVDKLFPRTSLSIIFVARFGIQWTVMDYFTAGKNFNVFVWRRHKTRQQVFSHMWRARWTSFTFF